MDGGISQMERFDVDVNFDEEVWTPIDEDEEE